jgi:hypothetical protein
MSGSLIGLVLALVYLVHTFFFWKSGRKFQFSEEQDQEKHHYVFEDENLITHARLSRFAGQWGRMQLTSKTQKYNHKDLSCSSSNFVRLS